MSRKIESFTTTVPFWNPFVKPIELQKASELQLEALQTTPSNTQVGEYVLVLAHDPETLKHRTPLFNGIMYSRGGLSRAETELSAVATSVTNECIYCTAVHASRYNDLTKTTQDMATIFSEPDSSSLEERKHSIYDFSHKLSLSPPEICSDDVTKLTQQGLESDEILDVVLSSAIFAWANRLMLGLGEPLESRPQLS